LDIAITDYLGNKATYDKDLAVDYTVPAMVKTIVGPTYPGPYGNETWLSCNSTIWLNATDDGCNGGAGVKAIGFTVWWKENKSSPTWNTTKYPEIIVLDNGAYNSTIYDNNPDIGKISVKFHFKEDCYHLLKAWAIDYVGNNNTIAAKNKHYVDCTPPWINKTIPKIAFIKQMKNDSCMKISAGNNNTRQTFIANWSYIDAINVSIYAPHGGTFYANLYNGAVSLIGTTESISVNDGYKGWLQLHFPNRIYLNHGERYWIQLISNNDFYWCGNNSDPYPDSFSFIYNYNQHLFTYNFTWDFAFKVEYYPIVKKDGGILDYNYNEWYSFKNGSYEHNGLNNTWITSKAFFHIASHDEGCMGGVGLASLQYRIWNESNGWGPWINYTEPFNLPDECKHYIEIKAMDHLGNVIIANQTHYVDNSPPTDVVDIPDVHGYYYDNITGKQFMRAGKGIWINLTDMPSCHPVGFRNATFYWRYTYTNFTIPVPEEHPSGPNDYYPGTHIKFINGKYWYVVYMNQTHNFTYISFNRECMHTIYYFYNATDWLDNNVTSEIKNITLYVDKGKPIAWAEYPWHYYMAINETAGYMRAGKRFNLYAKDMPDIIKIVCVAQAEGNQTDTLQNYSAATPWQWDAQSFVADCDHINATKLYLQWFGDVDVTVYIHNDTTMTPSSAIGMVTKHLTGSGQGWITFEFNPGITLHVGETYYIEAHANPASMCSWNFTSSDEYTGGHAWISGENRSEFDWQFQIISYDPNPCASGVEGIYYGFYYKGVWHPRNATDNVSLYGEIVNINNYYNESEIQQNFSGHHYWYVYNSSIGVVFHEECVHNFSYWAKDNVCHHSELYNHTFYVDATPPEATIEMPKCYRAVYGGKVDIVFLIDTSGSMNPVWDTLDSNLNSLINSIRSAGVDLNVTAYALEDLPGVALPNISSFTYPITTTWFNDSNISIPNDESWGTALSWIALWYPWREGAIRVAIPISDECAYDGDDGGPEDANDAQAVNESASLCHNNSVTVFPFYHTMFYTPPLACVPEMEKVANATGGEVFNITDLSGFSSVFLNIVRGVAIKESISCNATIHLSAIDYPITTGKVVDQKQTEANVYDGIENITFTPLYTAQSFVPSVDKLDAVQLLLDSGSGGTINVSIYNSGLQLLGYNVNVIFGISGRCIAFDPSPDKPI